MVNLHLLWCLQKSINASNQWLFWQYTFNHNCGLSIYVPTTLHYSMCGRDVRKNKKSLAGTWTPTERQTIRGPRTTQRDTVRSRRPLKWSCTMFECVRVCALLAPLYDLIMTSCSQILIINVSLYLIHYLFIIIIIIIIIVFWVSFSQLLSPHLLLCCILFLSWLSLYAAPLSQRPLSDKVHLILIWERCYDDGHDC